MLLAYIARIYTIHITYVCEEKDSGDRHSHWGTWWCYNLVFVCFAFVYFTLQLFVFIYTYVTTQYCVLLAKFAAKPLHDFCWRLGTYRICTYHTQLTTHPPTYPHTHTHIQNMLVDKHILSRRPTTSTVHAIYGKRARTKKGNKEENTPSFARILLFIFHRFYLACAYISISITYRYM